MQQKLISWGDKESGCIVNKMLTEHSGENILPVEKFSAQGWDVISVHWPTAVVSAAIT